MLEEWMRELQARRTFRRKRRLIAELTALAPAGESSHGRESARQRRTAAARLEAAGFSRLRRRRARAGRSGSEATRVLGQFLRDVMKLNEDSRNFRVFGPDETDSNRLDAVFEVTDRRSTPRFFRRRSMSAPDGRVMEVLSEHMCQGWLEGYLLTGRHGFFSCYEAFIHIIDSMFNQHAKWLKVTRSIPWRRPIASLNYLLTSPRVAAGSQRLQPSGPGLHRSRRQQEGGDRARLSAAGCKLPAVA